MQFEELYNFVISTVTIKEKRKYTSSVVKITTACEKCFILFAKAFIFDEGRTHTHKTTLTPIVTVKSVLLKKPPRRILRDS